MILLCTFWIYVLNMQSFSNRLLKINEIYGKMPLVMLKSNMHFKCEEMKSYFLLRNVLIFLRISVIIVYYSYRRSKYNEKCYNKIWNIGVLLPLNEKPMSKRFFFKKEKKSCFIFSNIAKMEFLYTYPQVHMYILGITQVYASENIGNLSQTCK